MGLNSIFLDGFLAGFISGLLLAFIIYKFWFKKTSIDDSNGIDKLIKEFNEHFKKAKKKNSDFRKQKGN